MPEPSVTEPAVPATKPGEGGGADPTKTVTPASTAFDTSKVGDEDFTKVFDDPRLWNHPRFKTLAESNRKVKEYEEAEEVRKSEELKKKGEWEKLASQAESKAKAAEDKYTKALTDNRIQAEAIKQGIADLEAVEKLIDRQAIKVAEDGSITGVAEAVKALVDAKPYLKNSTSQVTVGSGTAPGQGTQDQLKRFKLSQIQDRAFYTENEKDIMAAYKAGLIENDLAK